MPYYEIANLVTVTKTNMINEMHSAGGTEWTTVVRIRHEVSCRAPQWSLSLLKSPTDLRRGLRCSILWQSYKSHLIAFWMYFHICSSFQEHLRILLQSLRAYSLAPGGPGGIWKYLEAQVRLTGESGRFVCGLPMYVHCSERTHLGAWLFQFSWELFQTHWQAGGFPFEKLWYPSSTECVLTRWHSTGTILQP